MRLKWTPGWLAHGGTGGRGLRHTHALLVLHRQQSGDRGSHVTTLGDVLVVAKTNHQLVVQRGDVLKGEVTIERRGAGECEPRDRWDDNVEGVRQQRDHVQELDEAAGPAMGEQQRSCVCIGRTDVDVVQLLPLRVVGKLDCEVGVFVELGLKVTPGAGVSAVERGGWGTCQLKEVSQCSLADFIQLLVMP